MGTHVQPRPYEVVCPSQLARCGPQAVNKSNGACFCHPRASESGAPEQARCMRTTGDMCIAWRFWKEQTLGRHAASARPHAKADLYQEVLIGPEHDLPYEVLIALCYAGKMGKERQKANHSLGANQTHTDVKWGPQLHRCQDSICHQHLLIRKVHCIVQAPKPAMA